MGAIISRVIPGSIGQKFGFKENDQIITINGQLLRDIIDYYYLTAEHKLEINYVRNGLPHATVIHKEESESLGLDFENEIFDGIRCCSSKCMFCFVDQMPKKLRKTLYIKDDDYRLSFLHGNYITLTNLAENDLRRITAQRLSPLYVSVHATDPEVRARMMGEPGAANILKALKKLKEHNIQCNAQIVIVPGVNDGKVLKKTLQDLYELYPTIKTAAIVPVGITKHGRKDRNVRLVRPSEARQIYELVKKHQYKAQRQFNTPLFFLADEFYIMLNEEFPRHAHYGMFDQMGNGVGFSRKLITDFNRRKRYFPHSLEKERKIWVITGELGAKVLNPLFQSFEGIKNLDVSLVPVKNDFFGHTVTVAGLLTGQDIVKTVQDKIKGEEKKPELVVFPNLMLHEGKFLDDMTPGEIQKQIQVNFQPVPTSAKGLIEAVLGAEVGKKINESRKETERAAQKKREENNRNEEASREKRSNGGGKSSSPYRRKSTRQENQETSNGGQRPRSTSNRSSSRKSSSGKSPRDTSGRRRSLTNKN